MYQLTANPDEVRIIEQNCTIARAGRFWPEYETWLAQGNKPKPEFTAAELKAKAKAETEADARSTFNERLWQESPEKAALK